MHTQCGLVQSRARWIRDELHHKTWDVMVVLYTLGKWAARAKSAKLRILALDTR
jgi:hypothetical protein